MAKFPHTHTRSLSISLSPGVCVNGVRNIAFVAVLMIEKRSTQGADGLAAILVGSSRNHGHPSRHFLGPTVKTLIAAEDVPSLINFAISGSVRKWRQNYGILSRD